MPDRSVAACCSVTAGAAGGAVVAGAVVAGAVVAGVVVAGAEVAPEAGATGEVLAAGTDAGLTTGCGDFPFAASR
jgi:hypothetical protein